MMQYVPNKDAYEVVCRVHYRLNGIRKRGGRTKSELTRIGMLTFDLSHQETLNIQNAIRLQEERLKLMRVGGGFIRTNRGVRERSPLTGKII